MSREARGEGSSLEGEEAALAPPPPPPSPPSRVLEARTWGVGFERRISSVLQADCTWQWMRSRHSFLSKALARTECRNSSSFAIWL